jgi:23S rRNA (pseudouridine1915-N3)-methyltransferase
VKGVLIVVGKTTDKRFEAIIGEYVERICHYIPFAVEVVPELKNTKGLSQNEQKQREGELIQKSLQAGDYVVLLDEHGSERSSMDFAAWMQKKMSAGPKRLIFIIGGPYGFSDDIHKLANEEISLSRMTLSHQMVRIFFTEQIYRAMTILNGEPYHHE